jgi:hypothetical protein
VITNTGIASPALLVTIGSETFVLAACVTSPTPQLHYFIEEVLICAQSSLPLLFFPSTFCHSLSLLPNNLIIILNLYFPNF